MQKISMLLLALFLGACASSQPKPVAVADIQPTAGNQVSGRVAFYDKPGNNMRVVARIKGLTPGKHGFHVHENGDCSALDGMSAGGHYNPDNQPHGHYHAGPHHRGDMPNLEANAGGEATLAHYIMGKNFAQSGFAGRSIIIHANEDDYSSQPAGNSGARVGCGIIEPTR